MLVNELWESGSSERRTWKFCTNDFDILLMNFRRISYNLAKYLENPEGFSFSVLLVPSAALKNFGFAIHL